MTDSIVLLRLTRKREGRRIWFTKTTGVLNYLRLGLEP